MKITKPIVFSFLSFLMIIEMSLAKLTDENQFTATDLHKLRRLSSPVISPDKKYVVFSVREWNSETGRIQTHLEYTEVETGSTKLLTVPKEGSSHQSPTFNPDYSNLLFFISTESGSSQVWYIAFPRIESNEPKKMTDFQVDIDNIRVSGNVLTFSADVYFECVENVFECTANKNKEVISRGANTWGVYNKLMVRHWDRYLTNKVSHIFV